MQFYYLIPYTFDKSLMCQQCDPISLLNLAGVRQTKNRCSVLEVVANSLTPLSPSQVLKKALEQESKKPGVNKVTIYRILDLLTSKGVLNRVSSPDRIDRYCLAASEKHPFHGHFYCTSCHSMQCLKQKKIGFKLEIDPSFQGKIEMVQILIDGVCPPCMTS